MAKNSDLQYEKFKQAMFGELRNLIARKGGEDKRVAYERIMTEVRELYSSLPQPGEKPRRSA